ncbi:hypothetical protein B296_00021674 [Ensete ventricosum]|uniref:ubiquitinyl hydrolase 1 n=1 Tax=Ensete ventricosum TaxID=4639 RepID=A0A427AXK1_ENSVE|nr:hypothetical protein B296_00021674 [Ensete ventricosum]
MQLSPSRLDTLACSSRSSVYFCLSIKSGISKQGELALAFGDLLRSLWAPERTPVVPRGFKAKLARFAPQFSGFNQHDSQELLAFLLDGLHEDLNRVKHKPYVEAKDASGRPDEEVADEYWGNHLARNDSIIVDICQVSSLVLCSSTVNLSYPSLSIHQKLNLMSEYFK